MKAWLLMPTSSTQPDQQAISLLGGDAMKFVKHIENERGMALVTTMLFLVILFFLGAAAYMMTSSDLRISGYYRQSQEAFYAAESGIEDARGRLRKIYAGIVTPSHTWRFYIGVPALAAELNSSYGSTEGKLGDDMDYAVELRLKIGSDPNSGGVTGNQVVYWNGSAEIAGSSGPGSYPIFIATSLGAKGDARKKIIADIRGNTTFIEAPAALYVNGNLTKAGGGTGSAVGAWAKAMGMDCPVVPDIITTDLAGAGHEATDWPAFTSADPPYDAFVPAGMDMQVNGVAEGDSLYYDPVAVVNTASTNYDQLVSSGNNQTLGTFSDSPKKIFYCDGPLNIMNLSGYGVLAVKGDLILRGSVGWHGLIIATGTTEFSGGGTREVYGAVISNMMSEVNGTVDIYYDCSFLNDLMDSTPKFNVYAWKEAL